jgi:hypothetical protein
LIPVTIWNAHELTLVEFAKAISEKIAKAKAKKDVAHEQSTAMAKFIPSFLLQPMMMISTYLTLAVGINITPLGLRSDSFGHIILTNVGTLGYQQGFAPLCPPMRTLGIFCTGMIEKKAVVIDD